MPGPFSKCQARALQKMSSPGPSRGQARTHHYVVTTVSSTPTTLFELLSTFYNFQDQHQSTTPLFFYYFVHIPHSNVQFLKYVETMTWFYQQYRARCSDAAYRNNQHRQTFLLFFSAGRITYTRCPIWIDTKVELHYGHIFRVSNLLFYIWIHFQADSNAGWLLDPILIQ